MHTTSPRPIARQGALAVIALLAVVGCASGSVRIARPEDSAATPSPVATAASSTEPATPPPATAVPTAVLASASPVASAGPGVATVRPGPTPIVGEVKPAPEFVDLVKADGTPFTLADERGHTTLLFFGYTHCPDVCPATLGELMQVLQARPDVRVVFVTVDPERDTPEFLAEWTAYLPEGLVGVTGSPLAIRRAADQYGVRYARVDTDSRSGYAMSHTAFQYLIDGEGNLLMTYPFGTPAAAIVGDLDALDRAG